MASKIFKKKNEPFPVQENPSSNIVSRDMASELNGNKNLDAKKDENLDEEKEKEAEIEKKMLDNPILIMKKSDFYSSVDRETEQIKFLVNFFFFTNL